MGENRFGVARRRLHFRRHQEIREVSNLHGRAGNSDFGDHEICRRFGRIAREFGKVGTIL